jgi:hypothetical protein
MTFISPLDQNLIVIYYKFNYTFKSHIRFGGKRHGVTALLFENGADMISFYVFCHQERLDKVILPPCNLIVIHPPNRLPTQKDCRAHQSTSPDPIFVSPFKRAIYAIQITFKK